MAMAMSISGGPAPADRLGLPRGVSMAKAAARLKRRAPPYVGRRLPAEHAARVLVNGEGGSAGPPIEGSAARPGDVALIRFTSGTTGEPRGVMVRHEALVTSAETFSALFQSGPDSATAVVCPLFHNTGYVDGLGHMLVAGGRVDVPRRFDPAATAAALDIFIGAAQRIAQLDGVADVAYVRDKITELIKVQTLIWGAGVAASMHAAVLEPGVAVPDAVFANTGKHVAMEGHYTATRLLLEIAGGAVETLPSIDDQRAPELKEYFDRYYEAGAGTAENRIRVFRFIRDLGASEYAGWWDVEIIHGSGSPAAEWLQMYREYDLAGAAAHVERLSTLGA